MEKQITYENLRNFAYSNDGIAAQPIKGIVLDFFGLGGQAMFGEDFEKAKQFAKMGILYVVPYFNPWCWMNRQAVSFVDEILSVLRAKYQLSPNLPLVSSGASMGGLCALVYTRYAEITPVACVANCPVCDLPYHYTERPDLPRTLYSAFYSYEGTLDEAMRTCSPLHLAGSMPEIPYVIFHCDQDEAVNKGRHSDRFVAAMQEAGRKVTYHVVCGCGHTQLTEEMQAKYDSYLADLVLKA